MHSLRATVDAIRGKYDMSTPMPWPLGMVDDCQHEIDHAAETERSLRDSIASPPACSVTCSAACQ